MKNKIFYNILAILCNGIIGFILIASLFSCKTSEQLYVKAKVKDLSKVAELARRDFPCTTTKIDSVRTVDTLYEIIDIECPTTEPRVDSFETVVVNTVKVKVPREVVTIRTQLKVEDSAKIILMYAEIQKAAAMIAEERKLTADQKLESEKQRKSKNWWRKWCLITWGIIGAIIAFRLFRNKIGL